MPTRAARDYGGLFSHSQPIVIGENMKEIVRIKDSIVGGEKQKTVNARELWKALGSKQEFANWIKDRISGFVEGQDFTVDNFINGRDSSGRFTAKEYLLTLDVAKHLAMLERNEQGHKIRQYFIEIEKEYHKKYKQDFAYASQLLEVIRMQERELFAAEQELKEWRKLAPSCEPGELSEITGEPRIYLRRVSATSKKTGNSFYKFKSALDAANQVLPGFSEALSEGRIEAVIFHG